MNDRLTVVGNRFWDTITLNGKTRSQLGGIDNVPNGDFYSHFSMSRARIVNDKVEEIKWGRSIYTPNIINDINEGYPKSLSYCTHFAYLDGFVDEFCDVSKITGKKSCDFSFHNEKTCWIEVYKNLQEMDYIFCDIHKGDKRFWAEVDRTKALVIAHSSQGTLGQGRVVVSHKGKHLAECRFPLGSYMDTVGAGDRFAGYFLTSKKSYLQDVLKDAHEQTIMWLESVNKKDEDEEV